VEWSLDGPLPNLYPVIPTSNQDGHQAKNRKRGDAILIVHCCFSVSQNELKFLLLLQTEHETGSGTLFRFEKIGSL
jgi:cobalamin biosynthesis Mg chelatase CobN